jgi:dipeptidyl aminopeptidase/acylaminoacyl peptidase
MFKKHAAVFFLFAVSAFAQTKWTPEAMMRVHGVADVAVSPDGSHVAYTVSDAVMSDEKSESVRQIWIARTDGTDAMQVTFAEKSSMSPHWLPDSSGIVFTSARSGKPQLYLLRLRGGEAEPLTSGKLEIASFAISPDGQSVAFTASEPKADEEKRAKAKEDYRFVDEDQPMNRLYVMPLAKEKREPKKLVEGKFSVGTDGGRIDWSPDGKWIAFDQTRTSNANDWPTSDVGIVNVGGGEVKMIAATPAAEGSPFFSHDGQWIAYVRTDDPPRWAGVQHVHIVRLDGSGGRDLAPTFDAQANPLGFSQDDKLFYVTETRGTVDRIYAIDVAGNKVADVNSGSETFPDSSLNSTGTWLGFVMQAPDRPGEAFVTRADRFAPVQVSHVNDEAAKLPMPKTEVVRWKSSDGLDIEGLLTYPVGYKAGTKVPLLLNVHGGPTGVYRQTFIGNPSPFALAALANDGYAILRANPRGSSGYGQKFRFANYNDWGGGDYNDLMAGVDHVIAMGVADPNRLGVMGWSYGGYMTSWIITHTHRFKAAVVGAGVTDLVSFTGTADIPGFLPDYFGGQYWQTFDSWRQHSPLMHVAGVTTPTLIEHGEADERVPISQGYELYNALKAQNVPVRMLVLPRQHHGPREPKMILEAEKSTVEWMEKWIPR